MQIVIYPKKFINKSEEKDLNKIINLAKELLQKNNIFLRLKLEYNNIFKV